MILNYIISKQKKIQPSTHCIQMFGTYSKVSLLLSIFAMMSLSSLAFSSLQMLRDVNVIYRGVVYG